MGIFMGI